MGQHYWHCQDIMVDPDHDRSIDIALTELWWEKTYRLANSLETGVKSTLDDWNHAESWSEILKMLDEVDTVSSTIKRWNGCKMKLPEDIVGLWSSLTACIDPMEGKDVAQTLLARFQSVELNGDGVDHCHREAYVSPRALLLRDSDKQTIWDALYKSWDHDTDTLTIQFEEIVYEQGMVWNELEDWNTLWDMMTEIEHLASAIYHFFGDHMLKDATHQDLQSWHDVIITITQGASNNNDIQRGLLGKLHKIFKLSRPVSPALTEA